MAVREYLYRIIDRCEGMGLILAPFNGSSRCLRFGISLPHWMLPKVDEDPVELTVGQLKLCWTKVPPRLGVLENTLDYSHTGLVSCWYSSCGLGRQKNWVSCNSSPFSPCSFSNLSGLFCSHVLASATVVLANHSAANLWDQAKHRGIRLTQGKLCYHRRHLPIPNPLQLALSLS